VTNEAIYFISGAPWGIAFSHTYTGEQTVFAEAKIKATEQHYFECVRRFRSDAPPFLTLRPLQAPNGYIYQIGRIQLRDAIVLSGEWFVVSNRQVLGVSNRQVLCDFFLQTPLPPHSAYVIGFIRPAGIQLLFEEPVGLPVDRETECFLLGGCPNYSHWLLDYLPRLALCPVGVPLLVNGPLAPFQVQSLNALGTRQDLLVPLEYPRAYAVKNLIYPSIASSSITRPHSFQPWVLEWLRKSFAHLLTDKPCARRIFISRAGLKDTHERRLINHDEIASIAERMDFEVVKPENMTFSDQVRLFSQAGVVCGPHGAGLANIIFLQKGRRVIELIGPRFNREAGSMVYLNLARHLNLQHSHMVGQSDELGPIKDNHAVNETYTIDPKEFKRLLASRVYHRNSPNI
jgi:hypothetical protein